MTDLARIEKALRVADAAGDTDAARQLAAAYREASQASKTPVGDIASSVQEPLATLASSAVAAPVAGLAGLGAMGTNALGLTNADPADLIRRVQGAMTYQPRTQAGQAVTGAISYPFEKLAQGADWAGQKAADVTGSPAVGAGVNTAIQALPLVFLRGGKKGATNQMPHKTVGRGFVAILRSLMQAQQAAPKAAATGATNAAEAAAQAYVANTLNMDWAAIPRAAQETLTRVAADSKGLDKLDAAAVARQLQLQSLPRPVPATKGQLTRDPVQLRNEGNVSATDAGKPIREVYLDQNQALLDNLDLLKGRVSNKKNPAQTPEAVGISVQDQALRAKLKLKKEEVSAKFKAAEAAGELQGKVSPVPIIKAIKATPDRTHYGWVESWLNGAGVVKKTDAGTITRKLTLKEMEDLRQAAVARAMDGGTEGYYAGKIISAIDNATEGAGGNLYKQARAARKAQAMEFEETGAVARLVDNKSRTDRAVALEDTWRKTVIGGSAQDLRNVKRSLLTGGDASTRAAGKAAWRDLKAQTIQHIKDEATKSVALNERGQPNITPAAMKRAIDSVGKAKLDELFGPGTKYRLDQIQQATVTVKTVPPAGHAGSSTMSNILAFLEKGLGKVPVLGNVASGTVRAGVKLNEMGQAGRVIRESQQQPLPPQKAPPPPLTF
jgi:hypothetical protein